MKKLIAILLALIMTFSVTATAFPAFAAENTSAGTQAEESSSAEEPTYGSPGLTEQQIAELLARFPSGTGSKLNLKFAKVFYKLALVFGKLHLTSLKNAFLSIAANLLKGFAGQEPENPEENIEASITSPNALLLANKGETVTLTLNISSEPEAIAKYVVIGSKQYELTKNDDGTYEMSIKVSDKSGRQELKITKVGFEGNKTAETEFTFTIGVLKAKPEVVNFKIDSGKEVPEISFMLKDTDNAFKQGYLVVTNADGKEVLKESIFANENLTYAFRMTEGEAYKFNFVISYDLDHDFVDGDDLFVADETVFDNEITFTRNYDFTPIEFKLTKEKVSDGDDLVLTFKNGYESFYKVRTVVIGDKHYPVTGPDENGEYSAVIPKGDNKGEICSVTVNSVTLENDAEKEYPVNKTLSYIYLKDAPVINGIEAVLGGDKISVSADIDDPDEAVTSVIVILKDASGNEIRIAFADKNGYAEIELRETGEFTVEVQAIYELGDHITATLSKKCEEKIKRYAQVSDISVSPKTGFVNKGESTEVLFTIEDNTDAVPEFILINGEKTALQKQDGNTYNAVVTAPESRPENGIAVFTVTAVYYGEEEAAADCEFTREVLKAVPVVTNDHVDDSDSKAVLYFDLVDVDNAVIDGKVTVGSEEYTLNNIANGENSFELQNIVPNTKYDVVLTITYSVYNDGSAQTAFKKNYTVEIIADYNFQISDFRLKDVTDDTVTLEFTSKNDSAYYIEIVTINEKEYSVQKNGDTYTVKVPAEDFGKTRTELVLGKVVLGNMKAFTEELANLAGVLVFKTQPTAVVAGVSVSSDKTAVTVTADVTDPDNTVTEGYAVLMQGDSVIATGELSEDGSAVLKTENGKALSEGTYTVSIIAAYNAVDGLTHTKENITILPRTVDIGKYVSVTEISASKAYPKKGEEITLSFTVQTNTAEKITDIEINAVQYSAESVSDNTYTVTLNVPDNAGEQEYKVTKAYFGDEEITVVTSAETKVEVLKSAPSISGGYVDTSVETPTLSFDLSDPDNAFISGVIVVSGSDDSKISFDFAKPESGTLVSVALSGTKENVVYTVTASVTYDLDSDRDNGQNEHTAAIAESKFEIVTNYNFKITNFELIKIEGDIITLKFVCSNNSEYGVIKVVINGNEYYVNGGENNEYTVTVPVSDIGTDKTQLEIQKVTLENLKAFEGADLIELEKVTVFKIRPQASVSNAEVGDNNDTINVEYSISDPDNTLENIYVVLRVGDKVIAKTEINAEENSVLLTCEGGFTAGRYSVEITADYNAADGEDHIDENITVASYKFSVEGYVNITSVKTGKQYYSKGEDIDFIITVDTNMGEEIRYIKLNTDDTLYIPELLSDGTYKITTTVLSTAGEQTFEVARVDFDSELIPVENSADAKIEVLKSEPSLDVYTIKINGKTLTFEITDEDNSLVSGKVTVKKAGTAVKEYEFKNSASVIELNGLEDSTEYALDIEVTYDLDSDRNNGQNEHVKYLEQNNLFELHTDSNLQLFDFKLISVDNTNITLGFNVITDSSYRVSAVEINGKTYSAIAMSANSYTVKVPVAETGRNKTELKLTVAQLENLKSIAVDVPGVTVFLTAPTMDDPYSENPDAASSTSSGQFITVTAWPNDPDNAITNFYITLTSYYYGSVMRKLATKQSDGSYTATFTDSQVDFYNATFSADYEIFDGMAHKDVELCPWFFVSGIETVMSIADISAPRYVNKNETVKLTFTIDGNTVFDAFKARINNGEEVSLTKLSSSVYATEVTVPSSYGNVTYEITELTFANGDVIELTGGAKADIYVLRDAPTVGTYTFYDAIDIPELHIRIDDPDDTLLDKNIALTINPIEGEKTLTETIVAGEEKIIKLDGFFNSGIMTEDEHKYVLTINGDYDLDDNKNDNINSYNVKDVLGERKLEILEYEVDIDNISIQNVNTAENMVTVTFTADINKTELYISDLLVDGIYYPVQSPDKNGIYTVTVPYTYNDDNKVVVHFVEAKLTNGKIFSDDGVKKSFNIFLDRPTAEISDISVADNLISVTSKFHIIDGDQTVSAFYAVLKDKNGNEIVRKKISESDTAVTLSAQGSNIYTVDIRADYERYDGLEHTDEILGSSDGIEINSVDVYELKDITCESLYFGEEKIEILDITNGIPEGEELEGYYAKIETASMPAFYANIKEIRLEEGRLVVVPDEEVFVKYAEDEKELTDLSFAISYRDGSGEHKLIASAKDFFNEIIKGNFKGNYELTEDLDASDIEASGVPVINGTFTGTLNGNGHKIVNLPSTMFKSLNNATIENLIIENADVDVNGNQRGIIATTVSGSTVISNVHIVDSKIVKTVSTVIEMVGAFAGEASGTANISDCSAVNVHIKTDTQAAGIVGKLSGSAVIKNCYATGTIEATFNNTYWGARAGGIVAWDNSTGGYVDSCYANVKIVVPNNINAGGLVGGTDYKDTVVIKNSFAVNTGSGRKVIGFDLPESCNIENIWETNIGSGSSSQNGTGKIKVIENLYDESFYKNTLSFNDSVWNFELLKIEKLPNLINDVLPNDADSYIIAENANGIPNYAEVKRNSAYNADKENAYLNMAIIAPFTTADEWVTIANKITNENLISEKIAFILAFDENDKFVVGIQPEDIERLSTIKVIYESGKSDTFTLSFLRVYGDRVAEYQIDDLGLTYQYDSFIAKLDGALVDKLVAMAKSYDYSKDIASTTNEQESRLYVDYYNETLKSKIENAVISYLLTYSKYPVYFENAQIQALLSKSLTEETVKRLLYAYNYYDKWYNIGLDTVSLTDLLFFKGTVFGKALTTEYLIDSLYNTTAANRDTAGTYTYYNSVLRPETKMLLPEFLAYTFTVIDDYGNANDWFKEHFDGILLEQPSFSENSDEIDYRIWDLLSKSSILGDRQRNILPLLTAPQDDMFVISLPAQIVVGSLNRYDDWVYGGENREKLMKARVEEFGSYLGHMYGTLANLIPDSADILNSHLHFQYDTRFYFPKSDKAIVGTQDKGTTKEPVIKWFFEAINQLAADNGSGAYANGTDVWWVGYSALGGGDYNFLIFGHETAHNQEGYYFYDGYGRRPGTGAESHADDNFGPNISDNSIMFNLFKEYPVTADINSNFSYERIASEEDIKDFYFDVFETKYAIDYMLAEAFIQLDDSAKAKVAVQASHTASAGNTFSTTYSRISADAIKAMNLKNIKDLMDNKLLLHGVGTASSANTGSYGQDGLYNVYWYQPFNDNGAPDASTFRRNGKELLGIGGYMDGYVAYMSGKSKTDLEALRTATGRDDITWSEYKLERYERVKGKLDSIPYFDHAEMVEMFVNALKTDAANGNLSESIKVQKVIYGLVKRATGDFTDGTIFEAPKNVTMINTAQELIDAMNENPFGNYKLTQDIDFTDIEPAGGTFYVDNTFVGILDGNNKTIKGLQYPLCNSVAYAQFKDLTVSAESFNTAANAYLAESAKRSTINGVTVINSAKSLQYFAERDTCYEYGKNTITE